MSNVWSYHGAAEEEIGNRYIHTIHDQWKVITDFETGWVDSFETSWDRVEGFETGWTRWMASGP